VCPDTYPRRAELTEKTKRIHVPDVHADGVRKTGVRDPGATNNHAFGPEKQTANNAPIAPIHCDARNKCVP
jgi:hypothetical protein